MAIQRCGSQDYCPETIRCTWGVVDSVFSAGAPPVWLRYEGWSSALSRGQGCRISNSGSVVCYVRNQQIGDSKRATSKGHSEEVSEFIHEKTN